MAKPSHFEDFVAGVTFEFGSAIVDPDELHAFAERYDPQPIHLDAQAAAASPYGGIIASGWHTASLTMRMVIDHVIDEAQSLGSPGIGRVSWLLPVRPGDVLRARALVRSTRRSRTKPDRGFVTLELETLNARDEVVMRAEDWVAIIRLRSPDSA